MSGSRPRTFSAAEVRDLICQGAIPRFAEWVERLLPHEGESADTERRFAVVDEPAGLIAVQIHGRHWAALTIPEGNLAAAALKVLLDHVAAEIAAPLGLALVCTVLDEASDTEIEVFRDRGYVRLTELARYRRPEELRDAAMDSNLVWRRPRDLSEATAIYRRTQVGSLDCPEMSPYIPFHLTAGQSCLIYTDVAESACGISVVERSPDASCHLAYFGVVPEFRGREQGRRILESVAAEIVRSGGKSLTADVDVRNRFAISVYESAGFRAEGIRSLWARQNG